MGDLIVTATSKHSRNNRCGYLIGQGYKPGDAIKAVGMIVEGIHALPAAIELSKKYGIEMPIITSVDAIINHGTDPMDTVHKLMGRDSKSEVSRQIFDLNNETEIIKLESMRAKGDRTMKRVITYGTFDLLHYGHINLLRRA